MLQVVVLFVVVHESTVSLRVIFSLDGYSSALSASIANRVVDIIFLFVISRLRSDVS